VNAAVEDATFRIIQESLNNVVKHSRAPRAQVELRFDPEMLTLCTSDSGVGFDLSARAGAHTMGLASMRERAESVGGRLTIESKPGAGTRVQAELPVHDADER
jgi:signal transduction histidine kinase